MIRDKKLTGQQLYDIVRRYVRETNYGTLYGYHDDPRAWDAAAQLLHAGETCEPTTFKILFVNPDATLSMADRAKLRPANFEQLPTEQQWEIDKRLGIVDWNGNPDE